MSSIIISSKFRRAITRRLQKRPVNSLLTLRTFRKSPLLTMTIKMPRWRKINRRMK